MINDNPSKASAKTDQAPDYDAAEKAMHEAVPYPSQAGADAARIGVDTGQGAAPKDGSSYLTREAEPEKAADVGKAVKPKP